MHILILYIQDFRYKKPQKIPFKHFMKRSNLNASYFEDLVNYYFPPLNNKVVNRVPSK